MVHRPLCTFRLLPPHCRWSRARPIAARAALSAILALSACGGDDRNNVLGPPPPENFLATGDWAYSEHLTDQAHGVSCDDQGLLHLVQTGSTLSGSVYQDATCNAGGGSSRDTATAPISSGTLIGATLTLSVDVCQYTGTVYLAGSTPKGQGTASCTIDLGGGTIINLAGEWQATYVGDVTPPQVSGTLGYPAGDTLAVPGDAVSVLIDASDNVALRWVGYETGAPLNQRDSVLVTGSSARGSLVLTAPGTGPVPISVFARDSHGLRAVSALRDLPVLTGFVRHPTVALPLAAPVHDVAMDSARGLAYVTLAGRRQLAVVNLASGQYAPSLTLPFAGISVDLTLGGDSLLIAAESAAVVAVMRLGSSPITSVLSLPTPPPMPGVQLWGYRVRALAGNRAMVSLTPDSPYTCCFGYLVSIDLSTGIAQLRTDAGHRPGDGSVSMHEPLARSRDGQTLFMAETCCTPLGAQRYLAASNSFTALTQVTISRWVYDLSPDATANSVLFANVLLDGNLNPLRTFDIADYAQGGATLLSPDGATAYLATYDGYLKVRTTDGAILERVRLPVWAMHGAISPDGTTLVWASGTPQAFGPTDRLLLVDVR